MFNLVCKRRLLVAASGARVYGSRTRFNGLPNFEAHCVRFFSSIDNSILPGNGIRRDKYSFTLSYLINSCGLSPEAANIAAKKVSLKSPENPDLVLMILKENGLTDAHITKLVTKLPSILVANPEKTLLPKLDFFHSVGMSSLLLPHVLSLCPVILKCSLERRLIPFHNYLKDLLRSDEKVLHVYKRASAHYLPCALNRVPPNVEILRKCGVSESNIAFLLVHHPKSLMMRAEKLVESIERVVGLGIEVSKLMFVQAIQVLHNTGHMGWERKKQVYGRWGWSESDIITAFSIHSICMSLSEKKIMSTMEFLVNEMNYNPKDIASYPTVLFYNLEKRIAPRCRVVKVLIAKGILKKSYKVVTFVTITDKKFKEKFIEKHLEEVPQLLDVYCGKLSLVDMGLSSSALTKVKLL